MNNRQFTKNWLYDHKPVWDNVFSNFHPSKIIEVGCYEGRATCYFIETFKDIDLEIHCIDTWNGGEEHNASQMSLVESRFDFNIDNALKENPRAKVYKHKEQSDTALAKILSESKKSYFDLVFVDGSHQAPDVLYDACLAFKLVKPGGVIIFDDYLWAMETDNKLDLLSSPKIAIDSFINIHANKISIYPHYMSQIWLRKVAE